MRNVSTTMKHALSLLLLLLATAAVAHDGRDLVFHLGNTTHVNGHYEAGEVDALKAKYDDFVLFEDGGRDYVITDRATLDRMYAAFKPQIELGRRQGELGREQGKLGQEQGKLGREQGRLAREQARLARGTVDEARMEELSAKMRELSAEQSELGERQRILGERQRELGEKQRAASREAEAQMERILSEALRNGKAQRR